MVLTYVECEDSYSVYRDTDGSDVYIAHGPGLRRVLNLDEIDLAALWLESHSKLMFWRTLKAKLIDPDDADDVGFCESCREPSHVDDLYSLASGNWACEGCVGSYWTCYDCEERYSQTTTTLHDTEICSGCRDSRWSRCNECEGWYRDSDADDHQHGGCDCDSPAPRFTIRNDGDPALSNDTRATVTLPAGVISSEGLAQISYYVREMAYVMPDDTRQDTVGALQDIEDRGKLYNLSHSLHDLGDRWQTKDGNYTKRLSRYAYKTHGYKITPEILSKIGCIARDHSTAVDFQVEVTRNLNLSAEDFGHEESCWWGSHFSSRCALKNNGGFGLRTFHADGDYVTGRAWVMPLKMVGDHLTPTFKTQEPDAFVVFNGYGNLMGYTPARIVSHMAGMTYRKISFSCNPMWVNADVGAGNAYLVAPEEIASTYTDGSLYLNVDAHSSLHSTERKVLADVA